VLAALLILFWGAFFVEHLREWFVQPWPQTPPPKVWWGQALHLAVLLALAALWRWELAGGIAAVILSFAFFFGRAGDHFLLFAAVTALPGVLTMLAAWLRSRDPLRPPPPAA
jgi:hypothetical protein